MASAGKFDRLILIERATSTQDDSGQPTHAWAPFSGNGKRWAEYSPLKGSESFTAQQLVAKRLVEFKVRWDSVVATVTPDESYRITFDGRSYDITDVQPSAKRREAITFLCSSRAE